MLRLSVGEENRSLPFNMTQLQKCKNACFLPDVHQAARTSESGEIRTAHCPVLGVYQLSQKPEALEFIFKFKVK